MNGGPKPELASVRLPSHVDRSFPPDWAGNRKRSTFFNLLPSGSNAVQVVAFTGFPEIGSLLRWKVHAIGSTLTVLSPIEP
jgi:hypothetical protein